MTATTIKTALYLAIIAAGYLYVSEIDYQAAIVQQKCMEARAYKPICAERDYLGRRLIASYYATGDTSQIKRCTYARKIATRTN